MAVMIRTGNTQSS